jgi:hypothetical protein
MLRPKAWEPLVRHPEASALILPLLVLGADDPARLPSRAPAPEGAGRGAARHRGGDHPGLRGRHPGFCASAARVWARRQREAPGRGAARDEGVIPVGHRT